ncbi:NAD-dependent succinate-semialdehyde dehydrogenase [Aquimarina spongiae]|uniref:Succinate-semialdehyde dehydrogenase / glutarate-semialdehyde dehydrogenase n=1 Tax=Aquimarina spongiae TaxID=570521 RepID=A0A1M6GNH9_9FLAO|nr:NAD-dependent succinate-semialdehyde dehydrogenase [Aquimarina spongiae]SHJ11521.1 succinate-semialdehyde dehydrogenase / glutarate-semialdehyde dehydrogenase [Aquimarina spongiae]
MSDTIIITYPFTGEVLQEFTTYSKEKLEDCLNHSQRVFTDWKFQPISYRTQLLERLSVLLEENKTDYANLITQEMGKPYKESIAEIEKCIWVIDFYKVNAANFLADELIQTEAQESFISKDPLGTILGIMPWNYPFWQVFRFAVPTLTAGNTILLKHANNVTGCALAIQNIFEEAGYPKGCFQTIIATHQQIEQIIESKIVRAVSLTGSEKAGRKVAEIAGRNLKKVILELGGNNPCIIQKDADLETHIRTIVRARMQNTGQSCIAAKRFIVEEEIYDEFLQKFKEEIKRLKFGAPLDPKTEISTMAREDLAIELQRQVDASIDMGAKIFLGNRRDKAFFEPTILIDVQPGMPVFDEEVFGPVAAVTKAKGQDHAFELAKTSNFGLGIMVFTQDIEAIRKRIGEVEDGAFFINEMVKSDPRLPFGGTKNSGFGRELSKEGILAFVNEKTVYVK